VRNDQSRFGKEIQKFPIAGNNFLFFTLTEVFSKSNLKALLVINQKFINQQGYFFALSGKTTIINL
jgi:hypothetical protein